MMRWAQMDQHVSNVARQTTLAMIAARADGATVCPSEVARALATSRGAAENWRASMPVVHYVVDELLAEGLVGISWKGRALPTRSGPYRLHPGTAGRSQD